jgi:hypothetical protein
VNVTHSYYAVVVSWGGMAILCAFGALVEAC